MDPSCESQPFVLKPVSESILEHSITLKRAFPHTSQFRTHVDINENEMVLIYEYFEHDLLSLVQNNVDFSVEAKKSILREVGQALETLHAKHWVHLG